ncbi:MAG: bifunctional folylpolyglutamate synthase/dihydrofolate synthase [Clostridia bacterium]|nr:bifunctional folylpolyglutamate synthase/dihydrofolate synthase [Clostridia bacterium]
MLNTEAKCIEYIHSLSKFGKKAGLSNTLRILERLGNPHKNLKFIHVAGTNGKGSTSNMINNILISHNYKVGYYTSPYIELFNERICINNKLISAEDLVEYTNRVAAVLEGVSPIEFEFITALAFLYFYEKNCDVVVLEVGLGGRFDATNVIDTPLCNVITPIGLDHTAILGDTLSEIAFEKAGTIKQGSKVVVSPCMHPDCLKVIKKRCVETSSHLIEPKGNIRDISFDIPYTSFTYDDLPVELSLNGKYQIGNAITAIEAAKALSPSLGITQEDILNGLKNSEWKCRFEVFGSNPTVVLDGAHNGHGVAALMESVDLYFKNKKNIFVFSMLNEKDYKKSIELILKYADYIVATSVPSLRQTSAEDIYNEIKKYTADAVYIENPKDALDYAKLKAKNEDAAIFVFGSLYLSGMLRKYVNN